LEEPQNPCDGGKEVQDQVKLYGSSTSEDDKVEDRFGGGGRDPKVARKLSAKRQSSSDSSSGGSSKDVSASEVPYKGFLILQEPILFSFPHQVHEYPFRHKHHC
jgi:hypothetical protein